MSKAVPQDWFGIRISDAVLRERTVAGVAAMTAARLITQLIGLASMMVLARVLTPPEFGLVAIAAVVIGLADVLKDAGLTAATVRYRDLTPEQASNLFWLNVGLSAVACVAMLLASPALERSFVPGTGAVALALVFGVLLGSIGDQHRALLRRAVRFDLTMRIGIAAALAGSVVSVAGALGGAGYWSLVAGSLAGELVGVAMAWRYCGWRPGRPRRNVGTKPVIVLGLRLFAFNGLAYAASNLHTVLIGRIAGAAAAGLYTRAFTIHRFFREWILAAPRQVLPATMARLAEDPEQLGAYYYRSCSLVVIAAAAVTFVGLALPRELVVVLFGQRWEASVEIVRILSLGVVAQVVCSTSGWIYSSVGATDRMMRWGFVGWGIMIGATLVGARFVGDYGIKALAWAASLAILGITVPCMSYAFGGTRLDWSGLLRHLRGPLAAALAAGASGWVALAMIGDVAPLWRLLAGSATYAIVDVALLATVAGEGRLVADTVRQLRGLLLRRAAT